MTLASFPGRSRVKVEKAVCGWTRLLFQSSSNKGKKWGWGFVVVCEWTEMQVLKEEKKIWARELERGGFKYAFSRRVSGPCRWLAGRVIV